MALQILKSNILYNGQIIKGLAPCECAKCGGLVFLPAYNGLELVLPSFCAYCAMPFMAAMGADGIVEKIDREDA